MFNRIIQYRVYKFKRHLVNEYVVGERKYHVKEQYDFENCSNNFGQTWSKLGSILDV